MRTRIVASSSFPAIAQVYGITRQGLAQLHKKHGGSVLDPTELYECLLVSQRQSKLRSFLENPDNRTKLRKAILQIKY